MSKNFFLKSLAAIVLSLTLHTGVLAYFSVSEKAEIAGGAVSELDVLGNDFQDLVQEGDNLEPVKADQVEKVKDNYEVEPIKSREVSTTRSQTPLLQVAKPLKQLKSIKPVSSKTIKQQDKPKKALQKTKSKKVLTKKHSQKKQGVKTAKSTINKKKGRIDGIAAGKANNKAKMPISHKKLVILRFPITLAKCSAVLQGQDQNVLVVKG